MYTDGHIEGIQVQHICTYVCGTVIYIQMSTCYTHLCIQMDTLRVYRWNIYIHVCVRTSDLHLNDYVL